MKKLYLGVAFALISGIGIAQLIPAEKSAKVNYSTKLNADDLRPTAALQDRAAGDIIWSNDFSNANEWTAAGPSTDYTSNGWSIGSTTNGWYFGITGNMGTTGDFARFTNGDPNITGDVIENGPFTLEYTGVIDVSGIPAPHLEFEHYGARFITVQAVEVSTDGGNNWIQVASNEDLIATTATITNIYGQPDLRRFNISSAVAANPSNVKIRLFWDGAMNGSTMNYIEYGWYVDNIRIVEGHSYDSKLLNTYYRSGVGGSVLQEGLEYGIIPTSQTSPIEFSAMIESNGGVVQSGSTLDVEVIQNGSSSVFTGSSPNVNIAVGAVDSFAVATDFEPSTIGSYQINFTANQTNPDGNLSDNTGTMQFEVTNHIYGRDNNIMSSGFSNFASNNNSQVSIGNSMEIFENGLVSAIEVIVTTAPDNVGQLIYGRIYKLNTITNDFIEYAITEDYEVTANDLGIDNPIRLYLEELPVEVLAGDELLVTVGHYGGNPSIIFGTGQPVQQGTVLGYNSAGTLTSLIDPDAIMVRLNMQDLTSVTENQFEPLGLSQNVPNPFETNSTVAYTLNEPSPVAVEITDISGKTIQIYNQGIKTAGSHTVVIDGSQLSNGIYFYTLRAGSNTITKRMVVNR